MTTAAAAANAVADSGQVVFTADAMTVFWDLDNLRPPAGLELVWAFRLIEAAFEYADVAHIRAYARAGTLEEETMTTMKEIGITFIECPVVAEGSDVVLSTDVVNFVRNGGKMDGDEEGTNEAAKAVAMAARTGVMVATRDEGMAECVRFAKAQRDLCAGAVVCGEFLSKSIHRPQYDRALKEGGDTGITEGYWRILTHVAGKSSKGVMGKSKLVNAGDSVLIWDSKRAFDVPSAGDGDGDDAEEKVVVAEEESKAEEAGDEEEGAGAEGGDDDEEGEWEIDEFDTLAVPGGVSAMWVEGVLTPWPPQQTAAAAMPPAA